MSQPRKKVTAEEFWAGMDELKEQVKETDRRLEKQKRETDRRIKYLDELFTGQWGKLMESLVKGDLVNLLKDRGIDVEGTHPRVEKNFNNNYYEIDIIATNGSEVVVVEVKTSLKVREVNEFIDKVKIFKKIFPEYTDRTIYGAVAYLQADAYANIYAEKKGLFVIRATGSSASITNKKTFKPKVFG